MKLVTLAATLLATTALAAPAKFDLKGDLERGKAIFVQFCTPCHGDGGKGDGPAGAALDPKPANFTDVARASLSTDEQIYTLITQGGAAFNKSPLMISWKGTLNDQQIRDVATWIRNFSKAGREAAAKDPKAKGAPAKTPAPKK